MAITASYVSSNQFTVAGNKSNNLPSGLRLQLNMVADGVEEVTVDSSSYDTQTQLTTCTIRESVITPNLATIKPYSSYADNVGVHAHTNDASGGEIPAAHLSESQVNTIQNTPIPQAGDGKKFLRVADTPSEGYVLFDLIGAANQLVGANAAGDEIQFKTLAGATDEISVQDVAGTITIGLVQDYYTSSEIDTALESRDTAITAAQSDIDTHEAAAAPHSGHALLEHEHSADEVTSGTLDGDRLPTVSGTKRGGVPSTSGTPGSKVLYDDDTWKEPPGAAGGEANTTRNDGGGVEFAKAKDGTVLPFKTVHASDFEASGDLVSIHSHYLKRENDGRLVRNSDTELIWDGYGMALYDPAAARWKRCIPSSTPTLANTANDLDSNPLAYNYNYDIFAEFSSETSLSLVAKKWTNDTTRAVTPAKWQGVVCYDASTDNGKKRRFLGTVRLRNDGGTAKFTDTENQRFVSNQYNPIIVPVRAYSNAQTDYHYASNVWREADAGTSMVRGEFVICWGSFTGLVSFSLMCVNATNRADASVGVDSTNTAISSVGSETIAGWIGNIAGDGYFTVTPGYHYVTLLEKAFSSLDVTFSSWTARCWVFFLLPA